MVRRVYIDHAAGKPVATEVLEAMKERGLDMSGQTSKGVEEYLGKTVFAHTITVCGDAEENCPVVFLNMGRHEHWPFDDPAKFEGGDSERLAFTRNLRDQIDRLVRQWVAERNAQTV